MGDPWTGQRLFDASMAGLDDIDGNGANKGVERLRADRVDDAFAHSLRVETSRGEAFGQSRFFVASDLWPAQVVRAVAGAARDVRVDRTRAQYGDADIGPLQFVL